LERHGTFVVPVGEIESWGLQGRGKWPDAALATVLRAPVDPDVPVPDGDTSAVRALQEVRAFVQSVLQWLKVES
jgi:hypothetical protein